MTAAPPTASDACMSATEDGPPAAATEDVPPRPRGPAGPPGIGGVFTALGRRPILVVAGALLCGLVGLIGAALGPSSEESLFNLASYVPILGGAWAIWAAATASDRHPRGHLPPAPSVARYAATAFVVAVLSGLATVTLTVLGGYLVKTVFALGPIVALAELAWPPAALWGAALVLDRDPKAFLKLVGISVAVLVLTVLLVPGALQAIFGTPYRIGGGGFFGGFAKGLGWAFISALWMRFYLIGRQAP